MGTISCNYWFRSQVVESSKNIVNHACGVTPVLGSHNLWSLHGCRNLDHRLRQGCWRFVSRLVLSVTNDHISDHLGLDHWDWWIFLYVFNMALVYRAHKEKYNRNMKMYSICHFRERSAGKLHVKWYTYNQASPKSVSSRSFRDVCLSCEPMCRQ